MILMSVIGTHPMNTSIRNCAQNLLTALDSPQHSGLASALDSLPVARSSESFDTYCEEQVDILIAVADALKHTASPSPSSGKSPVRMAAISDILRQLSADQQV